jgi:phage baseplate assembly protein W
MADQTSFLGMGWSFPPTFVRGSGVVMVADEVDIRESLSILLSTDVGERVMQPKYGCDLRRLVFEPLDATLQTYMKDLIRTAILYFEPRVILENVELVPDREQGAITITISYVVATTNTRGNIVYPFYVTEGTEVG